jgi:hypothetical protein
MADSCRSHVAITMSNIPNNCRPNASVMKRSPKKKNPSKSEGYKTFPLTISPVTFLPLPRKYILKIRQKKLHKLLQYLQKLA